MLDDARNRVEAIGELSTEELREIWAIEYRTVVVADADMATLDERLNALGQERWDCYHVSEQEDGTVFYLKRRKSNALAHLTNLLRLGANRVLRGPRVRARELPTPSGQAAASRVRPPAPARTVSTGRGSRRAGGALEAQSQAMSLRAGLAMMARMRQSPSTLAKR